MDSALLKYFGPDSGDSCSNCVKRRLTVNMKFILDIH